MKTLQIDAGGGRFLLAHHPGWLGPFFGALAALFIALGTLLFVRDVAQNPLTDPSNLINRAWAWAPWYVGTALMVIGVAVPAWIHARRAGVEIFIHLHGLSIGRHSALWEDIDDVWWRPGEIGWHLSDGTHLVMRGLRLSASEATYLERFSWPLWLQRRRPEDAEAPDRLQALLRAATRPEGPG